MSVVLRQWQRFGARQFFGGSVRGSSDPINNASANQTDLLRFIVYRGSGTPKRSKAKMLLHLGKFFAIGFLR